MQQQLRFDAKTFDECAMNGGRSDSGRTLTEEDRFLWNLIGETVTPLRSRSDARQLDRSVQGAEAGAIKTEPPRRPTTRRPHPGLDNSHAPERPAGNYGHAGLGDKTARKLRKGILAIDSRIDLHGMTQERAHMRLRRFLEIAHHRGDRIVLVITGKGRNGGGVLRRAVPHWLGEGPLRAITAAWRQAHASHGGDGALYVRLRRRAGERGR